MSSIEAGSALVFLAAVTFLIGVSCTSMQAKERAADATFLADQLRCVDQSPTRDIADACREGVRQQWGITETTRKDSGQ